MDKKPLKRADLVYPELSYKIVGVLFGVYNDLGYGLRERNYQNAISVGLKEAGLKFTEQLYCPVIYKGENIGKNYFDFLIENKVVLEIKKGDKFSKSHIDQVYNYLVSANLKLGILAYFSPKNIHFKRIVNL